MAALRLSVVVVSRHRPESLALCVGGLRQQIGVPLELVVVADPAGCAAIAAADLKTITFDEPNISMARNLGITQAAGEVIAFVDDDCVPEPTWAGRLLSAFDRPDVVAATGFVRGRNGLGFQWQASSVDRTGQDHPLKVADVGVVFPDPGAGRVVKTQGTNCAFRAEMLRRIGGFDPVYRYFLDETDLNLRLSGLGRTAVVPMAEVHHGFHASAQRRADRTPLSLHDIGASTAAFLRRHAPESLRSEKPRLEDAQRRRLLRAMVEGRIAPTDVRSLLRTLEDGWQSGLSRPVVHLDPLDGPIPEAVTLTPGASGAGRMICGWVWQMPRLHAEAVAARSAGLVVTVLCLSPGIRRHRVRFVRDGYWLQSGGIWGKADRDAPLPLGIGLLERCRVEMVQICRKRPIN